MDAPRQRAGDKQRHAAAELVSQAFSEGKISLAEFDERSRSLWEATYVDQLTELVDDLGLSHDLDKCDSPAPARSANYPAVVPNREGSKFSIGIMGGAERFGGWHCEPSHFALSIMGGSELDFSEATLGANRVVINAWDLMGGSEIRVPENYNIRLEGFGIMGGATVKNGPGVTVPLSEVPEDAPTIVLVNYALMSGSDIIRVPEVRRRKD